MNGKVTNNIAARNFENGVTVVRNLGSFGDSGKVGVSTDINIPQKKESFTNWDNGNVYI